MPRQKVSKVVVEIGVSGVDCQALFVDIPGFDVVPQCFEGATEVIVDVDVDFVLYERVSIDGVLYGDLEGAGEESGSVLPEFHLMFGDDNAGSNDCSCDDGQGGCWDFAFGGQIANPPGQREKDSDEWNVGVAVGHGLHANLHDSDCGNECPKKPEPADGEIRTRFPKTDDGMRGADEENGARDDCQQRPFARVRIKHAELGGP